MVITKDPDRIGLHSGMICNFERIIIGICSNVRAPHHLSSTGIRACLCLRLYRGNVKAIVDTFLQ